ncbi:gem-associated protein 5 [Tribolium castaneum]|uniref:Uncharacterized protein n=1 Tax=Tribolium castaneum TaxID=7070 RepID=D1ZZV0_TRICA|nr:PREDICTED: gem-associated protein 5 [Tribolium castaneum]EFA02425.1 hypothetical protein TcasGA2_TC008111 [Tribolium castaneum]|eukprot:XP_001815774.1 PREDICTED: gem-associated protein 5 [Tribolium castaneum]
MNELAVPPAPLWYRSSVLACAPDNTLVYGAKSDIVIVREKGPEEPAEVKLIHSAHSKLLTSVSLNRRWKEPHSYVVSLGEDSVMKVWDLDTFEKKTSNRDHVEHKNPVIGAVFAGDDRVVSASSTGFVHVWNINTNESKPLVDLFKSKVTLTCLSSCPHAGWLMAFGLNNGVVIVADLRRNGQVLYKLRGHYQAVVCLSWCPAPVNIFPRHGQNTVKNKSSESEHNEGSSSDKTVETKEKVNPWVNLVHADDGEASSGKETLSDTISDFLKDCHLLKSKILGLEPELVKSAEVKNSAADNEAESEVECEREFVPEVDCGRPLPKLYDPSGDFLDDSVLDSEIIEDKDEGNEKDIEHTGSEVKTDQTDETREKFDSPEKSECDSVLESETEKHDNTPEESPKIATPEESPKVVEPIEEEPRAEYLLASCGKDKSVYIWRAGTDGRMQTFFQAAKKGNNRRKNESTWMSLCWIAPDLLLTSSTKDELLAWPLPKPKTPKQYRVVHLEHSSLIFNIVAPPKYTTAFNWREKHELSAWTWSQDGNLVCFDLDAEKTRMCFSCITAFITCCDTSPLDPNRLAIGLKDGGIKIWDLSLPHTKTITMQKYHPKYTHKVTTIAWHPTREMFLGFGTEEGRVGSIDLISKKTTLFSHYFHSQVYKVEWGPLNADLHNLGLYAVAEGKIIIYDVSNPDQGPSFLDLPNNLYVYKFAWKPDFRLLLLNGKDGSLLVLTIDLVAITTLYPNEKGLNGIVWHPDSFMDKTDVSPRCNWFAATTVKGILVYDCGSIRESDNFAENIVATFEGHVKPPLALAWCLFDGNRIASTASDGLVHVWDVSTKSAVATFVDFCLSHNPAVVWSPIDPDLIITGDRMIQVWRVSKNPPKLDEEFLAERKRLVAKMAKSDDKVDKSRFLIEVPKAKTPAKNYIVPSFYVSNDENLEMQVGNMKKLLDQVENKNTGDGKLGPLELFGSKEQVSQLLDTNYNQQKKEGKFKSCELISLWKGDVGDYIQTAIDENRVNPTTINLAAMVSPKLWQDACLSYAKKLSEDAASDPFETAMYFLACHKIEEAINSLCTSLMFKEALVLAKQRLPENSVFITEVTQKWAEHCVTTGNFENAAFCYISIKEYENAAKVLARRNHKEFLDFAAELAEKAGNKGLHDSIKYKCSELENTPQNGAGDEMPSRIDAVLEKMTENQDAVSESGSEITNGSHPESAHNEN